MALTNSHLNPALIRTKLIIRKKAGGTTEIKFVLDKDFQKK